MQYQLFSVMNVPSRPKIVIKKMMKKDSMMQEFELRKNQLECSAEQLKFSPTAARQRAVVARIFRNWGMVTVKRVSIAVDYINSRPSVQAWRAFCCEFPAFLLPVAGNLGSVSAKASPRQVARGGF